MQKRPCDKRNSLHCSLLSIAQGKLVKQSVKQGEGEMLAQSFETASDQVILKRNISYVMQKTEELKHIKSGSSSIVYLYQVGIPTYAEWKTHEENCDRILNKKSLYK